MNAFLVVLCLAAQAGNLGKTDAQILAMGRQKWFDFYTTKEGSSTVDMCDAERAYGKVLARRNDRVLKKADGAERAFIKQLRPALTMFQSSIYEVGGALSGGGTIWNIFYAGIQPDVEETVGAILKQPAKKVSRHVTSEVKSALDALGVRMKESKADLESMAASGGGVEAATKGLMAARISFSELSTLAAKRPRSQSDAILQFCLDALGDIREQG